MSSFWKSGWRVRKRWVAVLIVLALLALREIGPLDLNLYRSNSRAHVDWASHLDPVTAYSISYEEDDGQPYVGASEDTFSYHVVVRYRVTSRLTPWRWVPLYKSGHSEMQLTYSLWMGNGMMSSNAITSSIDLSVYGLASARQYRKLIEDSLIEDMKESIQEKMPSAKIVASVAR